MVENYFWDMDYTIPPGEGFAYFGPGHRLWLLTAALLCVGLVVFQRRWPSLHRWIAALLLGDELFKYAIAFRSGEFRPSVLPLHLCSIQIFFILADSIHPSLLLREELYAVCLPGALFALLFPGWAELPMWNAQCIHSFTAHILLLLYPLLRICQGFQPSFRRLVRILPYMVGLAVGIYFLNPLLGTNFMFLAWAGEGNPLSWLEARLGNPGYLLGIPLIAGVCWAVLYGAPKWFGKRRSSA